MPLLVGVLYKELSLGFMLHRHLGKFRLMLNIVVVVCYQTVMVQMAGVIGVICLPQVEGGLGLKFRL